MEKPEFRRERERKECGARKSEAREHQAVKQTGQGAAPLSSSGTKHQGQCEQKRGHHAVVNLGRVDDPERVNRAKHAGEKSDKRTPERAAREEEVAKRRKRSEHALEPAHG